MSPIYLNFMSKYNKKEIIDGIINLDKEIYKYLDATYRENVIQHVLSNSGMREDGEEHYQDVIFEIYLNIKRGRYTADGSGTFEGYLMTIMRGRWIDKLRKHKPNFEPLPPNPEIPYSDEPEALKNQRILAITKYMKELLPEEQEYIRLYYFAKKSLKAIADYFGTSHDYARLKLHRIRKKLRGMIANDPEFGTSLF